MPQINLFRVITAEEEIEPPVAIVVEPNCCVGVDPRWQSGFVGHAGELLSCVVMKEFWLAPLVQEEILVTVVVVVAPNGPHGNAGAHLVEIGDAHFAGHIRE